MNSVKCSAPGKVLWVGGYTVLERPNPALVTGVDKRVSAEINENSGSASSSSITFNLPDFNSRAVAIYENSAILGDNPPKEVSFVKTAVDYSLKYLQASGMEKELKTNFSITTKSDPAFGSGGAKSGLGSSAAVTVAAVGAVFSLHGKDLNSSRSVIHKIAQLAHSHAQGKIGSGFDVAAACFGGCEYSRYSPAFAENVDCSTPQAVKNAVDKAWDYSAREVKIPEDWIAAMGNVEGESASTSEMVKALKAWKDKAPEEYKELFGRVNETNKGGINALRNYSETRSQVSLLTFREAFARGWELTALMGEKAGVGIEPKHLKKAVKETSGIKGVIGCKLPGAGGGDSIAALCENIEAKREVEEYWRSYSEAKIKPIEINYDNEGMKEEAI
jgi:phosphomevalonate kinase